MIFFHSLRFVTIALVSLFLLQPPPAQAAETKNDAQTMMNGMRLKKWTKDLELTAEQQKKVQALYEDEARRITTIDNDTKIGVSERVAKVNALRQETFVKMKPLLSAAQLDTFEKLLAKMQPKKK
jgi:Spy/CpxP family protein refolding chaperone